MGTVRVLGRCDVDGVALRFRQADLVGLLAVRHGTLARATVAGLLWPEAESGTARHNLRQTLLALRGGGIDIIETEGEGLRLVAEVDLWAFEALLQHEPLPEALRIDELLPDTKGEWIFPERERLFRSLIATSLRLGERALPQNPSLALAYADAAQRADPDLESPRVLRVRALLAAGERKRAEDEIEGFERAAPFGQPKRLRALLSEREEGPLAGLSPGPLGPHDRVRLLTAMALGSGSAARAPLTAALAAAPMLGNEDRSAAETALAHLTLDDGDVVAAEAFARSASENATSGGRKAAAFHALARVLARTDRLEEAERLLTRAFEDAGDDREVRAGIEGTLGAVLARRHALPEADRRLRSALAIAKEMGCSRLVVRFRYNLAAVAIWAGRPELAAREAEAGLADAEGARPEDRAALEMVLARVLESEGRWRDARAAYDRATTTLRTGGDPWHLAQALTSAADLDRRRGARAEAMRAYREAIAVRRGLGDRVGLATALKGLGQALAEEGKGAEAEQALRESLSAYLASGEPLAGGAALLPLARLLRDLGRPEEALTFARRAVERLGRMRPDPGGLATDDTLSVESAKALVALLEIPGFTEGSSL